jgi:hypothetical protein
MIELPEDLLMTSSPRLNASIAAATFVTRFIGWFVENVGPKLLRDR